MEICPKCGKKVSPASHLTLAGSRDISQIKCECGYFGLPVKLEKEKKVSK